MATLVQLASTALGEIRSTPISYNGNLYVIVSTAAGEVGVLRYSNGAFTSAVTPATISGFVSAGVVPNHFRGWCVSSDNRLYVAIQSNAQQRFSILRWDGVTTTWNSEFTPTTPNNRNIMGIYNVGGTLVVHALFTASLSSPNKFSYWLFNGSSLTLIAAGNVIHPGSPYDAWETQALAVFVLDGSLYEVANQSGSEYRFGTGPFYRLNLAGSWTAISAALPAGIRVPVHDNTYGLNEMSGQNHFTGTAYLMGHTSAGVPALLSYVVGAANFTVVEQSGANRPVGVARAGSAYYSLSRDNLRIMKRAVPPADWTEPYTLADGNARFHGVYPIGSVAYFTSSVQSSFTGTLWAWDPPPTAARILSSSTGKISHARILRGGRTAQQAEIFHNTMKGEA